MTSHGQTTDLGGPYFEDLSHGDVFDSSPAVTLTEGGAATHQSIVGDRLRLTLDHELSRRVVDPGATMAHPAYAWDVAIGQSTTATQRVLANLFYRGLAFHRTPVIGDTLHTVTRVVGLKQNQERDGRRASGLAALRITTRDQQDRTVLDFWRCAMLPRRGNTGTDHHDDLSVVGLPVDDVALVRCLATWNLDEVGGPVSAELSPGLARAVTGGDVVSSAPELARLTLNIAAIHHDATTSGNGRLVYGGHTIGIALAQAARAMPGMLTVTGWHSCHHTGPVREGDTLHSIIEVERVQRVAGACRLAHLRSIVHASSGDGGDPRPVLDWRFVALMA